MEKATSEYFRIVTKAESVTIGLVYEKGQIDDNVKIVLRQHYVNDFQEHMCHELVRIDMKDFVRFGNVQQRLKNVVCAITGSYNEYDTDESKSHKINDDVYMTEELYKLIIEHEEKSNKV